MDPVNHHVYVVFGVLSLCYPVVSGSRRSPSATLVSRCYSRFLFRFCTPGTDSNPCLHTPCFFSPRSSLVAPPERLSPARPVTRLDSQYGRVNNDRVPRLPTPSSRQTPFHLFPGGSQYRSPLLLRDPGAGCTNTLHHTPHDFCFLPSSSFRIMCSQTTHTYGQSRNRHPFLHKPPCIRFFWFFAPLPTHSGLCLSADRCTGTRMLTQPQRRPQPTLSLSINSNNTSRMVREPHRTHGDKTRISSFTD